LLLALLLALPVAVLSMLAMHPDLQQKLEGPHGWGHQQTTATAATAAAAAGASSSTGDGMMTHSNMSSAGMGGALASPAGSVAAGNLKAVGGLPIVWIVQLALATGTRCCCCCCCWYSHHINACTALYAMTAMHAAAPIISPCPLFMH
jgi:hypothetical protein